MITGPRARFRNSMRKLSVFLIVGACLTAGALSASAERAQFAVRWVRALGFDPFMLPIRAVQRSRPEVFGDRVVVGTRLGEVRAFDVSRGNPVWTTAVDGPIEADLTIAGDAVYAGTISGTVYALSVTDGRPRWTYAAGHEVLGKPAVSGDRLVFAAGNNQIFALGVTGGSWLWQYNGGEDPDLSIRGAAGTAIAGNRVYTGFSNGVVAALDLATGKSLWAERYREESRFNDVDSTPVVADGAVYVVLFGSRLLALDPEQGGTRWSQAVSAKDAPVIHQGRVFLSGLDGVLRAYRSTDGSPIWAQRLAEAALNAPALSGDWVVVTGTEKGLWVLDRATGEVVWEYSGLTSGSHAQPATEGKTIFIASNLGHILKISPFWR